MNEEHLQHDLAGPITEGPSEPCFMCKVEQDEPLISHRYCKRCHAQLDQAYKWLQGPLVSKEEMSGLNDIMMDLTDVSKLELE